MPATPAAAGRRRRARAPPATAGGTPSSSAAWSRVLEPAAPAPGRRPRGRARSCGVVRRYAEGVPGVPGQPDLVAGAQVERLDVEVLLVAAPGRAARHVHEVAGGHAEEGHVADHAPDVAAGTL